MNKGTVFIDHFKLSQLLGLPPGYTAVAAHIDFYTCNSLVITVEGPGIPEVPPGERYPVVQLIDHYMTDENGVVWTRREIEQIGQGPLMQVFTESERTL